MDEFISKGIFYIVIGVIFLLILKKRRLSKKDRELFQQKYGEIKEKWKKKQSENFRKAIELYPSKHLSNQDKEWEEIIDKQRGYAQKEDAVYAKQLQKEYGLTEKEWQKIESQIFIEDAKELQENPEFQKALKNIKKNR